MTLTNDILKELERKRLQIEWKDFTIAEIRVNEDGHKQLAEECSKTSGKKVTRIVSLKGIAIVVTPAIPSGLAFVVARKCTKCEAWDECPTPNWHGNTMGRYIREICLTKKYLSCAGYGTFINTHPELRKRTKEHIKAHPYYANRYVET